MPLKHFTETTLVILLALVTIATGILASTLPPLPEGLLPWGILFGASILYPLVFYPLFRTTRADYFFRVLHFGPAAILLGWLLVSLAAMRLPTVRPLEGWYTWGFGVVPVVVLFFLIALFCFQVLRRRAWRITLLALLLIPFAYSAYAGRFSTLENRMTAFLWGGMVEPGVLPPIATTEDGKNIDPSKDPDEEEWREKLRALDERMRSSSTSSARMIAKASVASAMKRSSSGNRSSVASVKPPTLPSAGFGSEVIAIAFLAGYCGTLQKRAARRIHKITDHKS